MIRKIKPEIRIVGWDDAPFTFDREKTQLFGAVCRGGTQMDGVMRTEIKVDGRDSTEKIADSVKASEHGKQLRVIMLDGITFGGFNIVDIKKLNRETGLPVIVFIRDRPSMDDIRKSLERLEDSGERWSLLGKAGAVKSMEVSNRVVKMPREIYYQSAGISDEKTESIINITAVNSVVPEPLRIAHLICSAFRRR